MNHWRWSALVVLAVSTIVLISEYLGWLSQFEKGSFDWLARQERFDGPAEEVRVVAISETDYENKNLFNGKSPLNQEVVGRILAKIASGCPAVIAVDLVNPPKLAPNPNTRCAPRIVYAIAPKRIDIAEGRRAGFAEWFFGGQTPTVELEVQPPRHASDSGLPVFPLDEDGMVRRYTRSVRAFFDRKPADLVSLNARVVESYCEAMPARGKPQKDCLNYEINPETFLFSRWDPGHVVVTDAGEIARDEFNDPKSLFEDKIVLFGGHFSASRDAYATPGGTFYGVDLLALAVDSDLHRYWAAEVEPWLAFCLDFYVGAAIVVLFATQPPVRAFLLSVGGTFLFAVLVSKLLFHRYSYALNFMAVAAGVLIHQLYEQLKSLQELEGAEKRVHTLERELRELKDARTLPHGDS